MTAPPLIVFAYKRADLLARVLASVRTPAIPVIYAYSDAPKTDADAAGVADVRRLLASVTWTEMHVVERPTNFGLGRSILDGVTTVLRDHPSAVILEDDIELAPGTYDWMAAALAHYAQDPRVMSVSAWTHPRVTPAGLGGAPFFSGRASNWGWATWARAWKEMPDHTALEFLAMAERAGVPGNRYGIDVPAMAAVEREKNIWAVRLLAMHMAHHGLALHPGEPYAKHIGWDPRATHATSEAMWNSTLAAHAIIPERWPEPLEHPGVAALWRTAADHESAVALAPRRPMARLKRLFARMVKGVTG